MPAKQKYDWENWFKNRVITLERGKHFTCTTKVMGQQVRNAASRYRVKVVVSESVPDSILTIIVSGGERRYWWEDYLDELQEK